MKMADMGFVFTTVFLISHEFVKTVLLDFSPSTAIFAKAKFGKRKFFLRHPVQFSELDIHRQIEGGSDSRHQFSR